MNRKACIKVVVVEGSRRRNFWNGGIYTGGSDKTFPVFGGLIYLATIYMLDMKGAIR